MAQKIFTSKSKDRRALFDHVALEQQVKEVIREKFIQEEAPLANNKIGACKTFVVATRPRASGSPVLMRTYDNFPWVEAFPGTIWQAARATTAAPTLFLPVVIDDIQYCDGGIGYNNPAELAIDEAHNIWPGRCIGCLVSVGTGLEDAIQLGRDRKSFARQLLSVTAAKTAFSLDVAEWCVELITSNHSKHLELKEKSKRLGINESYFRFNVPQGMSEIGLEDWQRIEDIIALTVSYMTFGLGEEKQWVVQRLLKPSMIS